MFHVKRPSRTDLLAYTLSGSLVITLFFLPSYKDFIMRWEGPPNGLPIVTTSWDGELEDDYDLNALVRLDRPLTAKEWEEQDWTEILPPLPPALPLFRKRQLFEAAYIEAKNRLNG